MNRIDRLVGIVIFLQGRRVSRAEDIAAHFETSVRTIYRDIAALGEAGVPIVSEAGVGYGLLKGYHLPPVTLSPEEAGALAMGGVLVSHMTDSSLTGPMRSALLKIRAVLPREHQERLERVENATRLSDRTRRPEPNHNAGLLLIQAALARRNVLLLRYRSGSEGEITSRAVEPTGLIHYLQRWHLIAWCRLRSDFRDFRLDRIESIDVSHEQFAPRDGFSFEDYVKRQSAETCGIVVRVHFERKAVERARREWLLGVIDEKPASDGSVFTFRAGPLMWYAGWLLSFGPSATVIEPAELRTLVIEAAERAIQHHRNTR